jgi:hypothetical protein
MTRMQADESANVAGEPSGSKLEDLLAGARSSRASVVVARAGCPADHIFRLNRHG